MTSLTTSLMLACFYKLAITHCAIRADGLLHVMHTVGCASRGATKQIVGVAVRASHNFTAVPTFRATRNSAELFWMSKRGVQKAGTATNGAAKVTSAGMLPRT